MLFRQRGVAGISFSGTGAQRLIGGNTGIQFLDTLLVEETASAQPDAVIFIGPKVPVDSVTSQHSLKTLVTFPCPVFYLTYSADDALNPSRDAIGSAVISGRVRNMLSPVRAT